MEVGLHRSISIMRTSSRNVGYGRQRTHTVRLSYAGHQQLLWLLYKLPAVVKLFARLLHDHPTQQ